MVSGQCAPSSRKFMKPLDLLSLMGQAGILAGLPYPPEFLWVIRNQLFWIRARLLSCLSAWLFHLHKLSENKTLNYQSKM